MVACSMRQPFESCRGHRVRFEHCTVGKCLWIQPLCLKTLLHCNTLSTLGRLPRLHLAKFPVFLCAKALRPNLPHSPLWLEPRCPVQAFRCLALSAKAHGNTHKTQWNAMKCNEMQWSAMRCHERRDMQWDAMKRNEMQWNAMKCHEMQWNSMKRNKIQRDAMKCHEMPWDAMKLNESSKTQWDAMRCNCNEIKRRSRAVS